MADSRGKAWPLADADLTNSVSLCCISPCLRNLTYVCILLRFWSLCSKPASTNNSKRVPMKVRSSALLIDDVKKVADVVL
jgi:hypothetical protein